MNRNATVWRVTFSSIEDNPRIFNASFSAVKGPGILHLDSTSYGKVE